MRVMAKTESFKNAFKDTDMAGDSEHAFLLVTILLSRFIEKLHEDRVVQ